MLKARFNFGKMVGKGDLYDRDEEVKKLVKILSENSSAALGSIKGMGKSSLAMAATEYITDKTVIWISLENVYTSLDLVQQLINGLHGAMRISGIAEKLDMLNKVKHDMLTSSFSASSFLDAYFGSYIANAGMPVLVLDEITRSRRLGRLYKHFINILYHGVKRGEFQVIMVSSEIGALLETIKSRQLPFDGLLEFIDLKPLDEPTSLNFLYEGLEFYGAECPKRRIYEYYRTTEGIPVWLALSGARMVEGLCNSEGIYRDDRAIKYILEQLVDLSKKEMEMLRLVSQKRHMGYAGTHLKRNLYSLVRRGLVATTPGGYMIPDPIMEHMLKYEIL
ncbi:MAG: ATP-binding protein [Nitrososphaeria archaeon]